MISKTELDAEGITAIDSDDTKKDSIAFTM